MKKTYINPVMDVIEIKANHQLLAGSVTIATLEGLDDYGGELMGGSADAREFDFDLDDDVFDEEL